MTAAKVGRDTDELGLGPVGARVRHGTLREIHCDRRR